MKCYLEMDSLNIGSWNIRGLNSLVKREVVKKYIVDNTISVFAIIETRVQNNKEQSFSRWFGRK